MVTDEGRRRGARRRLIIAAARTVAEAEGWDAVTTRRLSGEIECSQPVLYKHFSGMAEIAAAVAIDGFGELAAAIRAAGFDAGAPVEALIRIADAYLDFARRNPAVYDAMFTRATTLRFATRDVPLQLTAAFTELHRAVGVVAYGQDADAASEDFFAALHGLVTLSRGGRIRRGHHFDRVQLLVEQFTSPRRTPAPKATEL